MPTTCPWWGRRLRLPTFSRSGLGSEPRALASGFRAAPNLADTTLRLVFDLKIRHGEGHDRLGRVQSIFGLLVDYRIRAVDHLVGHLVAAIGRQRVHVEHVGPGELHP